MHEVGATLLRASPLRGDKLIEDVIDITDLERGLVGMRVLGETQRCPSDAELALLWASQQDADHGRDLVGGGVAEEAGQRGDLLRTFGSRAHARRRVDEVGELHPAIVRTLCALETDDEPTRVGGHRYRSLPPRAP